ncbi:hypothetical protein FOMPIDRAFT_1055261 [Fomitopsis schrenkii]|uniref:Uncharacterized protein n=1 Tax=Fomitopsis schrenkii TaxID=2126942 RepID=S8EXG6_FOMSC|nr:hypothetical protein FOMPIDRAFT_1055261 [Fomitopsis schrenkii]
MATRELKRQKAYRYERTDIVSHQDEVSQDLMAACEALEQHNAHQRECTPAANTQLNALAPISRLPPEVLSEIFLQHVRHCADHVGPYRPPGVPVGRWIRVTHVSAHWRETALRCAVLWSHLEAPACRELLAELLTHTGQPEPSEDTLLLALSALHRVKTLYLYAPWDYRVTDAVLRRLGSGLADLYSSISGLFSHPEARLLRTFVTVNSRLTWGDIPFDGLARLDISGDCQPSQSSTESFLTALGHMPCLEELTLNGVFIHRIRGEMWGSSGITMPRLPVPIALPHLRLLRVHQERVRTTTTFLNNLHTPSLSHLSVVMLEGRLEDTVLLFKAMAKKAATLGRFTTISVLVRDLYISPETHICIRVYRNVYQRTTDPKDDSTLEWLQQHVPVLEYRGHLNLPSTPSLAKFCQILPVRDAQSLILGGPFPTLNEWLRLTRCMEAVTELRLYRPAHDTRPGKVLSLRQRGVGDARRPFVLPNLRALTIEEFNFRGAFPRSLDEPSAHGPGIIPELQACFSQRAEEGSGIKTLRIRCAWQLREEDLERLREAVPCVESDGTPETRSLSGLAA